MASNPRLNSTNATDVDPITCFNVASDNLVADLLRRLSLLERVTGIEPVYPAWKAGALADVLHPHVAAI